MILFWLMKSKIFRDVVLYVIVISVICLAVLYLVGCIEYDTLGRRKQTAARARELANQVKADPKNSEALRALMEAAQSKYHFERDYARNTLGKLGGLAKESVPILAQGLRSDDGFERDASAHALFDIGKHSFSAKVELLEVIRNHVNESAARYAIEALGEIGDNSPEVLETIKFAAYAKLSLGHEEAREVYKKLTGKELPAKLAD